MKPEINLVAVAYNAPMETDRFLSSVISHADVPFTLTVVENDSPDERVMSVLNDYFSGDRFRQNPFMRAYCISRSGKNVGYARACNAGAREGNAPYIALLNCDIEFTEGALSSIVKFMDDNPDVGVVGPRTVDSTGRLTHGGIFTNTVSRRDEHRFWLAHDWGQASDVLDVPTVSGATYFVRRSMWKELTDCVDYATVAPGAEGAFLPTKHFYEETWCSYHARAHHWRVVYLGTVRMIHQWHRSSPIGSVTLGEAEEYFRKACEAHGIGLDW